jgi:hypothetical protein
VTTTRKVLYRAVPYESHPVGSQGFLVHVPGTNTRFILPSGTKRILDGCHRVDSVEGHASWVAGVPAPPGRRWSSVDNALEDLISRGLLVPVESLAPPSSPRDTRTISCVAFPTADRAASLRRALSSYAEGLRLFGRSPEILVMDDSKTFRGGAESKAILAARDWQGCRRHAGFSERRAYVEELARNGIDPEVARFAILGDRELTPLTFGANRNSILLDTIGEHVFMADDDTVCQVASHPEAVDRLVLSGHSSPREMWFYADRQRLVADLRWQRSDVLEQHERLLGRTLGELMVDSAFDEIRLDEACDHVIRGLQDEDATVIATMGGLAGDSGVYSNRWFLIATGATRQRLAESREAFDTAFATRDVLGVARSHTVTHSTWCMATTLGLANVAPLPPFLPVYRNEDGFFGALCSLVEKAFFGHVPAAVLHDAEAGRVHATRLDARASDLMIALVSSLPRGIGADTPARLRAMGVQLRELARLPEGDFWSLLHGVASQRDATLLQELDAFLREFDGCPDYWRERALALSDQLLVRLTAPGHPVPLELADALPADGAKQMTRSLVESTGSLLYHWPDLLAAARDLRSRGVRISVPV